MGLALPSLWVHLHITPSISLVTQFLITHSFIHSHPRHPSFHTLLPGLDEMLISKDATILQLQQELLLLQQSLDIAKASQTTMKKEIDDRKSTASEDVARWCDTRSASSFLCPVS